MCEVPNSMEYDQYFSRLPVFGRWEFSLGPTGWPADEEKPASATVVMVVSHPRCKAKYDLTRDIFSRDGTRRDFVKDGLVCGGTDYLRVEREEIAPPQSSQTPWLIAGVSCALLVVIVAALVSVRVRRNRVAKQQISSFNAGVQY